MDGEDLMEQMKFSIDDYRKMEDCLSTVYEIVKQKLLAYQPCPLCRGPVKRLGEPPHTANCPVDVMKILFDRNEKEG